MAIKFDLSHLSGKDRERAEKAISETNDPRQEALTVPEHQLEAEGVQTRIESARNRRLRLDAKLEAAIGGDGTVPRASIEVTSVLWKRSPEGLQEELAELSGPGVVVDNELEAHGFQIEN